MLFKRDTVGNSNQCGIASYTLYPTVKLVTSNQINITTTTNKASSSTSSNKPVLTTTQSTKPIVFKNYTTTQITNILNIQSKCFALNPSYNFCFYCLYSLFIFLYFCN